MVWARTGSFSEDAHSKLSSTLSEASMKDLGSRVEQDESERRYIVGALAAMDACLRNLDIIYKKRSQDFQENERLRNAYFETVKDNLDFGSRARDFLKSLPAVAIGGAGGLTLTQALGMTGNDLWLWVFGLTLAAAGYLVNLVVVRIMRRKKQRIYLMLDYEKGLYFEQYLNRAAVLLTSLVRDLDRIHKKVFGLGYPNVSEDSGEMLSGIFNGIRTEFCPYVHRHMRGGKITPELWPVCEVGGPAARADCAYWEGGSVSGASPAPR
jgi:hypothetical protein